MDRQSFVPDSHLQRAVKNVIRLQALEKAGKDKRGARPQSNRTGFGNNKQKPKKGGGYSTTSRPEGAPSTSRKTQQDKGGSDE